MKRIIVPACILAFGCGDRASPPPGRVNPPIAAAESAGSLASIETAAESVAGRPLFVSELPAGEGIWEFRITATPLRLRAAPSLAATVTDSLTLPVGTTIEYDDQRYQTMRAGVIAIVAPTQVTGRNLGSLQYLSRQAYYHTEFPHDTLELAAGTTAEYLMYRAEGTCFIKVGDEVIDAHYCPVGVTRYPADGAGPSARLVRDAEVEWWIRVILTGQPRGWALVDGRTIQVARHE